jgi:CRISPR/Cas system Type II protein with McrA/HNH and RuvC-like nuclease domain
MLGDMPKSQEKVITKIKWVCYSKAMKKKKKGKSKKSGKRKYEWRQESNYW